MKKHTLFTILILTTAFVANSLLASAQHPQQPELLGDSYRPVVGAEVVHPASLNITQSLRDQMAHLDTAFAGISNENITDVYVFLGGTGHGKSTLINISAKQPLVVARRELARPEGFTNNFDYIRPGASQVSVTDKCNVALHDGVLYVDSPGFMDVPDPKQSSLSTLSKYFSTSYLFEKLRTRSLHPKIILCIKGNAESFTRTTRGGVNDALSCLKMFGHNIPWKSVQLVWNKSNEDFKEAVKEEIQEYFPVRDIVTFHPTSDKDKRIAHEANLAFEAGAVRLLENGEFFPSIANPKFARDFNSAIQRFFAESVTAFHTKMREVNPWREPRFILGKALEPGHVAGIESVINSDARTIKKIASKLLAPIKGEDLNTAQRCFDVFKKFTDEVMDDSDEMIKLITEERLLSADQLQNLKERFSSVMALKVFATENANDPINSAILEVTKDMKQVIQGIKENLKKDLETKQAQAAKHAAEARAAEEAKQRQIAQNARVAAEAKAAEESRKKQETEARANEEAAQRQIAVSTKQQNATSLLAHLRLEHFNNTGRWERGEYRGHYLSLINEVRLVSSIATCSRGDALAHLAHARLEHFNSTGRWERGEYRKHYLSFINSIREIA